MTERAGQMLGNYRLVQLLGQGSVTEVYLGEHIRQKTLAALKVWHNRLDGEDSLRFQAEAGRIALLEHEHIVPLLEYGVTENLAFVAMEYASGKSLRLRYHRGMQLSLATIVPIARQLAEALEYAHNAGIVHGDIKPENMLSRESKEVLLSDFSMASIAHSSHAQYSLDMADIVAYMAPEQLQGQVEKASDQYGLAVVIYEWLSGKLPFYGSFTEVATQHLIVPPAPLHTIVPTVLPAVEEAVLKALEKNPRKRFKGVREFVRTLEAAQEARQAEKKSSLSFGLEGITDKPDRATKESHAAPTDRVSPSFDRFQKYWQVIAIYDMDIQLNPRDAMAYSERGDAYYMLEEYERAILDYSYALSLDSKCIPAYSNRGLAYSHIEEYKRAIADFTRAMELDANEVSTYYNRGNAYALLEDYVRAIADYDSVLRRDERHAYAYYNRGNAYARRKDFEQAIADYSQAIALDAAYLMAYCNRGKVYSLLKNHELAIADYTRAIELDPHLSWIYSSRGEAYCRVKAYRKAIDDLDRALDLDDEDESAYTNRGLAHFYLREYELAIADYTRAIALDAEDAWSYSNRGLSYYHLKEYEKGIQDCSRAIELNPLFGCAYDNRGTIYLALDKLEEAREDLLSGQKLTPEHINHGWSVEWSAMCLARPDEAMAQRLEALAEIDPKDYIAYVCRGVALWIRGDFEGALAELERAIPLELDEDAYFWKGMACASLGRDEEAAAALKQALDWGVPRLLQAPLDWLREDRPEFYERYVVGLYAEGERNGTG
jgi:tetratricopeptide (TPR) repeat protein/tRNA A-37 threonylcarbamoyl transferase component Bud32